MPANINDLTLLTILFVAALALLIFFRYFTHRPVPQSKPLIEEQKPDMKTDNRGEDEVKEVAFEFSEELYRDFLHHEPQVPWGYNQTYVKAMYRDPHWVYVYWEVTNEKQEEVDKKFGTGTWNRSTPILRVYNVTGREDIFDGTNPQSFFDIGINFYAKNHYLEVGAPNQSFCIDLARILPDGTFYLLARSNIVLTPRDNISEIIDPNWPPIDELYGEKFGFGDATSPGINKNK